MIRVWGGILIAVLLMPGLGLAQVRTRIAIKSHSGAAVGVAPSFTLQPISVSVTAGQTATFTIVVAGDSPITCQWRQPAGGSNIAGATSCTSYAFVTVGGDNGATFDVVATNASGSATSDTATLTVTAVPILAGTPGNGGSRLHRLH